MTSADLAQTIVATVSSSARKIHVNVTKSLTIEESRDLRKILKAEEAKAATRANTWGIDLSKFNVTYGHYGI